MPLPRPSPIILSSSPTPSSPSPSPSHETASCAQDTNYSCVPCLLLFTDLANAQRHYQTAHALNHDDQVALTAQITVHQRLDHEAAEDIKQTDTAAQLVNQVRASRRALQASGAHRVLRDMLQTPGQKRSAPAMFDGPPPTMSDGQRRKVSRSLNAPVRDPSSPVHVGNCSPLTAHLDLRSRSDSSHPRDCLQRDNRRQAPRADLSPHRHASFSHHIRRNAENNLESL